MISYFTGTQGNCPAEWADDKIRALQALGKKVIVITGIGSKVVSSPYIYYVCVPSLSWNDYKIERAAEKKRDKKTSVKMKLLFPVALLIGSVIDFIMRYITKGISGGRWSWFLTALPVAYIYKVKYRCEQIFVTGGPNSAHLVGGVIKKLSKATLLVEFQDPVLGIEMNRSSMTAKIAYKLERYLAATANKLVYATKQAAEHAKIRYPQYKSKITAIYPGAWQFAELNKKDKNPSQGNTIEIVHLGTLYSSRNLDFFFEALDSLKKESFKPALRVKVTNIGSIYCNTVENYKKRDDFILIKEKSRIEALQDAAKADLLLLVQHRDKRSQETIPYKTYDYLNLHQPILGLLKNDELSSLIEEYHGFCASVDDVLSIKNNLKKSLIAITKENENQVPRETFDICQQVEKVLM